ncbi:hypothetical protein DL771_004112 [Monosporascus sp. 5C6A]|nr:hypothetical protein DL771_004112 [Monosporascus sp. 5C6A]
MSSNEESSQINETSLLDTLRVLTSVVAPTVAKGVIKRRPSVEALAQHHGLDTKALQLLQDLRRKYGSDPLQLNVLLRSQVLILDPKHVAQVLSLTPIPFGSASKEKRSALRHFEPSNILIADPEQRSQLRPIHEHALATNSRIHPFASRFSHIIPSELSPLFSSETLDWTAFSTAWSKITLRIALGDSARDDNDLIDDLDYIRQKANWGFMAFTDKSRLESYQAKVNKYISKREEGSLVSRLPGGNVDLASQVAQWLFAFDAAAMATFRALALLGAHPQEQERVFGEARGSGEEKPFTRGVLLESLRLWPTTPAILREATEDAEIGGRKVEKGTGVAIFAPFFHRDNETLGFADKLAPEQWADKEAILEKGLVPFSAGPAMCPAHNLVPMVASLVMCGLVKERKIELVHPQLDVEALPGTLNNFEVKLRLSMRG